MKRRPHSRASKLHQKTQNKVGEGLDVIYPGDIYARRDELEKVEGIFKIAIQLSIEEDAIIGQGKAKIGQGEISMCRGKLVDAESAMEDGR